MKFLTKLNIESEDSPLNKIFRFKALFALASDDFTKVFNIYLKSLKEEISYAEYKELKEFYDIYRVHFKFKLTQEGEKAFHEELSIYLSCQNRLLELFGSANEYKKYLSAVDTMRTTARNKALKLFERGLPFNGREYRGITQGVVDLALASECTRDEAQALFLYDYLHKQKNEGRAIIDLNVNILESTEVLVDSFKLYIKDQKAEFLKNILKQDGRLNTPDFDLWELYLAAYLLKVKQVSPNLLNPKWPKKILNRQEAAKLLFSENQYAETQKLDKYVREARKLIKTALNNEGFFNFDSRRLVIYY